MAENKLITVNLLSKNKQALGRVDLYGLKFVQSRGDLIAARGLESSGLSKNRAKLPRPAHAPYRHPCRQQRVNRP